MFLISFLFELSNKVTLSPPMSRTAGHDTDNLFTPTRSSQHFYSRNVDFDLCLGIGRVSNLSTQ